MVVSLIVAILLMIWLVITKKNQKIVLEKSKKIDRLLKINDSVHFKTFEPILHNLLTCKSKKQLELLSMDDYLISLIDDNDTLYRDIVEKIDYNIKTYEGYLEQISKLKTSVSEEYCQSFGFSLEKFLRYEEQLFKRKTLKKPQTDITLICKAIYTSPQGKNYYQKIENYNVSQIRAFLLNVDRLRKQRQTRQYQIKIERAKMSDSMRYDILKRDGYRCQICGSTAQDGVKLHVDHIIPVSKGGKTEPSNLRTLCDRCNIGKGAKS